MYARLRALTLVAVVVAVPLQQVVPAVAPASTVGPCASIAIGITDDWCTDTCTQGDGSYCNTASCVCGEEAKTELAKPDRAIDAAPVGAPAPTAVPVSSATGAAPADPRAEYGEQPLMPATTPAPVPTPVSKEFPTENVCNFDTVACINTTTDEMVPCLGWEERHPEASPSPTPTGKGSADAADPASRWSAHNARLRRTGVRPARPPLDPRALCDEKTGKPTNGSVADCRSCEHHIKWCYESTHFDESGRQVSMTLEDCMDYVADKAQECGPAGCRYACSMCSTKESKMTYKGRLGLPMNEPAPISPVAAAAEIANNQKDETDNARRKAQAEAAQAAREAEESSTAVSSQAAAASGQATGSAATAATTAAEAAAAEAAAAAAAAAAEAAAAAAAGVDTPGGSAATTVSAAPAAPSAPPTLTAAEMSEAARKASDAAAAQAEKAVREATRNAAEATKAMSEAAKSAADDLPAPEPKPSSLSGQSRLNRAASANGQPDWELMGPTWDLMGPN